MPRIVNDGEVFHYCCLWPHSTGLPMRVWVPDDGAVDGNIRVQTTHTAEIRPNDVALVSISERPWLVEGELQESDAAAVSAFVMKNLEILRAYRYGDCDSGDLVDGLRRHPPIG